MRPPAKRKMSTGSDSNSAGGQSGAPDVIYADIDADSQAPTQVYSFLTTLKGLPIFQTKVLFPGMCVGDFINLGPFC